MTRKLLLLIIGAQLSVVWLYVALADAMRGRTIRVRVVPNVTRPEAFRRDPRVTVKWEGVA